MSVHEIRHPLVRHKIDLLREAETGPKLFRELSAELATLLTYEALRDLTTERKTIQGWAGAVEADHLRVDLLTAVPVVRARTGPFTWCASDSATYRGESGRAVSERRNLGARTLF